MPEIKKLLIANRGEIALRIHRACHEMGIKTVAVHSTADADAMHVRLADEAICIGPPSAAESYLNIANIISAAEISGADAIHPGYGFLSENAKFAEIVEAHGLIFVGPKPEHIRTMGDKVEAKRTAGALGLPLVPGSDGALTDSAEAKRLARDIGYPVLIKAASGGGGRGMKVVPSEDQMETLMAQAGNEAKSAFGDATVYMEKYLGNPRHIEFQVFGDGKGNAIHLGERDCSLQRRHQKVLEEAPAPGMSAEMRQQMGQAAVAAARAVNYVGAGTVEFIVEQRDGNMSFFFMEMNTRLQVEHPVTEAITGLDLVEWQLRVAAGEPLPLQQAQLQIRGHAIEARICAENPDKHFLPATGTLQTYALPDCSEFGVSAVRVDSGVREGDTISPFYDSMVAKLIVHGDTREQALARLDAALAATRIVGLQTNVQFLRHVLASRSFAQADLDTALIAREAGVLFEQEKVGLPLAAAAVVAHTLLQEQAGVAGAGWTDPWARRDGWRSHGVTQRYFDLEFHGERHTAVLHYLHYGALQLQVGETAGALQLAAARDGIDLGYAGQRLRVQVVRSGEVAHVFAPQGATQLTVLDALAHAGETQAEGGRLTAPMPGKVVSFAVKAGDAVTKGQVLAVMEAMKMEHTIAAPADGTVAELLYAPGDQVAEGAELLKLSAA
jgi:3-methylcrotonyl-CoA carboxylase alpha subunit